MSRGYNDRSRQRVSLLVRNLPLDARADEVREKFERFGEIRDVYLPRDYYTGRSRGFGFIEYRDPRDADDAMYRMDGANIGGRDITVVQSKEARKTPREMIVRDGRWKVHHVAAQPEASPDHLSVTDASCPVL
ncbi:MAG: pre-mRNA splicing factor [Trebouxia sp. A1-2]|nr:MAG: pre-mRNA splicing factor [Trebouxia sp. A1-2]